MIECAWDDLLQKVNKAEDLDHIIAAHQQFLDSIITRCLMDEVHRVNVVDCIMYVREQVFFYWQDHVQIFTRMNSYFILYTAAYHFYMFLIFHSPY